MAIGAALSFAAAICGALIWAAVITVTGYELGYLAWGLGALCGAAAAVGARDNATVATGIIAVVCSLVAIAGGKLAYVEVAVSKIHVPSPEAVQALIDKVATDEALQFRIALQTAELSDAMGLAGEWPEGKNIGNAEKLDDLPERIRRISREKWDKMSPAEIAETRKNVTSSIEEEYAERKRIKEDKVGIFLESFGLLDIVFGLLAVGSAFKLGSKPIEAAS